MIYLLQNRFGCGDFPIFWRFDDSGYTSFIDDAKRFTSEEADAVIRTSAYEKKFAKVRADLVEQRSMRVIALDVLNELQDNARVCSNEQHAVVSEVSE